MFSIMVALEKKIHYQIKYTAQSAGFTKMSLTDLGGEEFYSNQSKGPTVYHYFQNLTDV